VMGRGFLRLVNADLGFETSRLIALNVSLTGTAYERNNNLNGYYRAALERLRAIPGVESVAASEVPPFSEVFRRAGSYITQSGRKTGLAHVVSITPGYFRTIGVPLLAGRDFLETDLVSMPRVAIVSESVARGLGGPAAALGQVLVSDGFSPQRTIVGVAGGIRESGPAYSRAAALYVPAAQAPPGFATLLVRVRGKVDPYLAICRDALREIDRAVPVDRVETLEAELGKKLAPPRFYMLSVTFFGGFSLLLAMIAIYGAASYSVEQRRHEIGVRAALGASTESLRLMLLGDGAVPIVIGIAAGAVGASALGRAAQALIAVAEPPGIGACAGAGVLLAATALLAIQVGTRRILKLDPMTVLR